MRRLNWGSAFDIREGWVNSDLLDFGQEHVGDLLDGLPFADNEFDMIVINHAFHMLRFEDHARGFAELLRVLKPGGYVRMLTPNAEWAFKMWREGKTDKLPVSSDIEPTADGRFLRYLFWHGDIRSSFTKDSLPESFERHGFADAKVVKFKQTVSPYPEIVELDTRPEESLIVEATKR